MTDKLVKRVPAHDHVKWWSASSRAVVQNMKIRTVSRRTQAKAKADLFAYRSMPEPPVVLDKGRGRSVQSITGFQGGRFGDHDPRSYGGEIKAGCLAAKAWNAWADARDLPKATNYAVPPSDYRRYQQWCVECRLLSAPASWYALYGAFPPPGLEG